MSPEVRTGRGVVAGCAVAMFLLVLRMLTAVDAFVAEVTISSIPAVLKIYVDDFMLLLRK